MEYKSFIGRFAAVQSVVLSGMTTMFDDGATRMSSVDCVGPETAIKSIMTHLQRNVTDPLVFQMFSDKNNPLTSANYLSVSVKSWTNQYHMFTSYLPEINKMHLIAIARMPANSFRFVVTNFDKDDKVRVINFIMTQAMQRIPIPQAKDWVEAYEFFERKGLITRYGGNYGNQIVVKLHEDINLWIKTITEALVKKMMEVA